MIFHDRDFYFSKSLIALRSRWGFSWPRQLFKITTFSIDLKLFWFKQLFRDRRALFKLNINFLFSDFYFFSSFFDFADLIFFWYQGDFLIKLFTFLKKSIKTHPLPFQKIKITLLITINLKIKVLADAPIKNTPPLLPSYKL